MVKLAILATMLAIIAPSLMAIRFAAPQYNDCIYIVYDPNVYSVKKGFQQCSYSSPSWVSSFSHPRLSIESTFEELQKSGQHPTIQKSFKLIFKRPLTRRSLYLNNYATYQEYTVRNPDYGFAGTFDSGLSNIPGWLAIQYVTSNYILIIDYSTATFISVYKLESSSYGQKWFNLYLFGQRRFFAQATGIMVEGCSNNVVYPWQSNFASNPNLGRKKRATAACEEVAKAYAEKLSGLAGFSYENVLATCEDGIKFEKNTPELMIQSLESLAENNQLYQKMFSEEYVYNADEAEEILAKEEQSIQEQLQQAAKEQ